VDEVTLLTAQVSTHATNKVNTSSLCQSEAVNTGVPTVGLVLSYKTQRYSYYKLREKTMPTITYMTIEQAEEEIRQHEVTERIRRFATSDPEVYLCTLCREKSKPKEVLDK
jgi:hypothetical protein